MFQIQFVWTLYTYLLVRKGTTTNVGLTSSFIIRIDKKLVVFLADELDQGTDLNGDGDFDDFVPHVFI